MAEVGLPALNFGAWWAMWGPPGMPADLTKTINGWVNDAVKELGAEGRLAALGIEPSRGNAAGLRASSSPRISTAAPSCSRRRTSSRSESAYFVTPAACATAATLARCSSIAAANSAALPGRIVAPVG